MTTGLLGKAALAASTYTAVYTVTASKTSTANVRIFNRDQTLSATIRLAICPAGYTAPATPANADYIEPLDLFLPPGTMLEEVGLVLSAGEVLVAFANIATVTVRAYGFEA